MKAREVNQGEAGWHEKKRVTIAISLLEKAFEGFLFRGIERIPPYPITAPAGGIRLATCGNG